MITEQESLCITYFPLAKDGSVLSRMSLESQRHYAKSLLALRLVEMCYTREQRVVIWVDTPEEALLKVKVLMEDNEFEGKRLSEYIALALAEALTEAACDVY